MYVYYNSLIYFAASNGIINAPSTSEQRETEQHDKDAENDSDTVSQISATLDLINLVSRFILLVIYFKSFLLPD